jgi:hypothetical protein
MDRWIKTPSKNETFENRAEDIVFTSRCTDRNCARKYSPGGVTLRRQLLISADIASSAFNFEWTAQVTTRNVNEFQKIDTPIAHKILNRIRKY